MQEQSGLISKLVRLYEATGGDYWQLRDLLDAQIKEAEAGRSEEEVRQADQNFKNRELFLQTEAIALETRFEDEPREKLEQMKARRFFKPRR